MIKNKITQKYFIGKCGGKDCSWRLHDGTNRTYYCSLDLLDLYMHNCPKKVYENCPHGKTLDEMAEYIESEGIVFRSQAKEVIEALAEVKNEVTS